MKNILYIGRFQPFHKGHADAIIQIIKMQDTEPFHVYIGIGSAEDNFLPSNPLTAGERFEIISEAMKELQISRDVFSIIPIRNINHYALWTVHVQQYLPPIHAIASGSDIVHELFANDPKKREHIILKKNIAICASLIRKATLQNESISKYILSSTKQLLENFGFQKRMQSISENK